MSQFCFVVRVATGASRWCKHHPANSTRPETRQRRARPIQTERKRRCRHPSMPPHSTVTPPNRSSAERAVSFLREPLAKYPKDECSPMHLPRYQSWDTQNAEHDDAGDEGDQHARFHGVWLLRCWRPVGRSFGLQEGGFCRTTWSIPGSMWAVAWGRASHKTAP